MSFAGNCTDCPLDLMVRMFLCPMRPKNIHNTKLVDHQLHPLSGKVRPSIEDERFGHPKLQPNKLAHTVHQCLDMLIASVNQTTHIDELAFLQTELSEMQHAI